LAAIAPCAPAKRRIAAKAAPTGGRNGRVGAEMFAYLVRRLIYAVPILIGVNLLTFLLFFVINSPDDMARMHLGARHATEEGIERCKAERGYHKPTFWNA